MPQFIIHDRLLADSHALGRLKFCHVLLHKNALIPWFILVPETDNGDLLDLPAPHRNRILEECAIIASFIKQHFHSTKINFATLGNRVPQLHLHIIGRSVSDPCWPRPVWDNLEQSKPYTSTQLDTLRLRLRDTVNLQP